MSVSSINGKRHQAGELHLSNAYGENVIFIEVKCMIELRCSVQVSEESIAVEGLPDDAHRRAFCFFISGKKNQTDN